MCSGTSLLTAPSLNQRSSFGEAVAITQAQSEYELARSSAAAVPPPERLRTVSDAGSVIASVVDPNDSMGGMPMFSDGSDDSDDSCEL